MDNSNISFENPTILKTDQDIYDSNTGMKPGDDILLGHHDSEDRLSTILTELVKIQKEDRADDRMGNKKFLLSLLPFMEKLPDDVNLEVRLQLMSILQTYSNGESFMRS